MIRGFFLAATFLFFVQAASAAEPEKVRFKQSGNPPRDLPGKNETSLSQSEKTFAYENYQDTLKAWYSARKRLRALGAVSKILQNDPSSDKEVVAMVELMAIEKKQEIENLRAQLAGILGPGKMEDPKLPQPDREEILVQVK